MDRQEALAEARLCVKSAEASSDPEHRSALLELAGWWNRQADWPSRSAAEAELPARRRTVRPDTEPKY